MSVMAFREPNQVLWRGIRPGHNGTQIIKDDTVTGTVKTIYTVSSNVTFYLTSWTFSIDIATIGDEGRLYIQTGAAAHFVNICRIQSQVVSSGFLSGNFWPPLEVPMEYTIKIYTPDAGCTLYAMIHGWEE